MSVVNAHRSKCTFFAALSAVEMDLLDSAIGYALDAMERKVDTIRKRTPASGSSTAPITQNAEEDVRSLLSVISMVSRLHGLAMGLFRTNKMMPEGMYAQWSSDESACEIHTSEQTRTDMLELLKEIRYHAVETVTELDMERDIAAHLPAGFDRAAARELVRSDKEDMGRLLDRLIALGCELRVVT